MPQKDYMGHAYTHIRLSPNNAIRIRHYSEIMVDLAGAYDDDIKRGIVFGLYREESAPTGRILTVFGLEAIETESPDDKVFDKYVSDKFDAIDYANRLVRVVAEEVPFYVEPAAESSL